MHVLAVSKVLFVNMYISLLHFSYTLTRAVPAITHIPPLVLLSHRSRYPRVVVNGPHWTQLDRTRGRRVLLISSRCTHAHNLACPRHAASELGCARLVVAPHVVDGPLVELVSGEGLAFIRVRFRQCHAEHEVGTRLYGVPPR